MAEEEMKNESETIPNKEFGILGIFPCPVYITKRDSNSDSIEEKEIEDIIKEGLCKDGDLDHHTNNTYIFDTKLKNLKEFCEKHIKIYVKEILNPKQELDFYITQSWLNVIEPGGMILRHWHSNSIISGAFYQTVEEEETDKLCFHDPLDRRAKCMLSIEQNKGNPFSEMDWSVSVDKNILILFPSWLEHSVQPNEKATRNRISLSFNTFAKGIVGKKEFTNELIL